MTNASNERDDTNAARRHALQLLGAGIAAPALFGAATAQAQPAPPAQPQRGARPLRDPRSLYPRPPFAEQQQPWPGLASKMQPPPDHGEESYVGSGRLAGRKALITGGDSGIGRAAAIAFAREGADVALGYLPAEESDAKQVVALIREAGRKAVTVPGDIRSEAFCRRMVADAAKQLGGLDVLVNNAAYQQSKKSILEITSDQFDSTMKTNLYATFWITKAALAHIPAGGAIIVTASVVATAAPEELLDYAATKGGLVTFTKVLAKQLASKGIRVNAVAPGPYWTPLQPSGGQIPGELSQFGADTPLGRPGQPAEIASLFVLLASQEATFTSGNVFSSTGGNGDA